MPEGSAVQSVERAMAVLDAAAASPGPVTAKALARQLDCALSTAYNLVNTLLSGGYLERVDGGYVLGRRVSALHHARAGRDRAAQGVGAVLDEVRRAVDAPVYYAFLRDGTIMVESAAPEASEPAPMFPLGRDPHAHATAHGKVLLARLTLPARRRYLETSGMPRLTRRTITHPARLELQLQRVLRAGFAQAVEESAPGKACLSVPVTAQDGRIVAALSVALPTWALTARRVRLLGALRWGAEQAARQLAGDQF